MFFLVGVIYERTHTRNLNEYGGLFPLMPVYGGILIFTSMASLGLPGLNGFISEFLVVRGSWPIFTLYHRPGDDWPVLHRRLHPERDQAWCCTVR